MTLMLLITLFGCSKDDGSGFGGEGEVNTTPTGDDTDTAPSGDPEWTEYVSELPQGMFTGAFSRNDELLIAGGEINGVGKGFVAHLNGDDFCIEEDVAEHALWWLHGDTPDRFFASGEKGTILRYEDETWHDESIDGGVLYGIFDTGERVWAVRGNGTVWTRDDTGWWQYTEGLSQLFKTWCASEDQCVFVGANRIYTLDGDEWTETSIGDNQVWTCRGRSWEDIWCVGGDTGPVMYNFNGSEWLEIDASAAGVPMFGVWVDNESDDIWVGGAQGYTARYADGEFDAQVPLVSEAFHAVWKHNDEIFFVGGNLGSSDGDYHGTIVRYGDDMGTISPTTCDK